MRFASLTQTTLSGGFAYPPNAIGRREAKDIGLPVKYPDEELEDLMWELYLKYEEFLKLREPIYPEIILKDKEQDQIENMPIAVIESTKKLHIFKTNIELKKKRNIPPNPQININLGLQLPPEVNPQQIPHQLQQILNQILNQVSQMIPNLVRQEIIRQSPVIGIEGRAYGGKWVEEI